MHDMPTGVAEDVKARIRAYYHDTWFEYTFLWVSPRARAMHLGHWGPVTRTHSGSLLEVNRLMAEKAAIRRGESVLDAGCGIGGSSVWLAERFGVSVTGINLVNAQVERATRYAAKRGMSGRARFEVADYTATRLPGESFDVAWAQESICHAPDKAAFLNEAFRLLKPGGRLVMVDYIDSGRPKNPDESRWLDQWVRGWSMAPPLSHDDWRQAGLGAGFTGPEFDDLTDGSRRSARRLYRFCLALYPVSVLLHRIGVRSAAAQDNIRGSRDQWPLMRDGHWTHELLFFRKPGPEATAATTTASQ